jgi:hypothetical protein
MPLTIDPSNPPGFSKWASVIRASIIGIAAGMAAETKTPNLVGTGFAIRPSEYFLTCDHVLKAIDDLNGLPSDQLLKLELLDNKLRVAFSTPDGFQWQDVQPFTWLRVRDVNNDIAILNLKGFVVPDLELRTDRYTFGEEVGVMGFPLGNYLQTKSIAPLVVRTVLS